jgi:hypothetical protein
MANDYQTVAGSGTQPSPKQTKLFRTQVFVLLLGAFLIMILVTAISFGFVMIHAWEGVLRAEIERSLTEKARMFADNV